MFKAVIFAFLLLFPTLSYAQVQRLNPNALQVTGGGTTQSLSDWMTAFPSGNISSCVGRTVTVATDTITSADAGCPVIYDYSSSVAVSIASASTSGLSAGFGFTAINNGTGTATITPSGSTINGGSSLAIPSDTGCYIYSDGTNYQVDKSACSSLPISNVNITGGTITGATIGTVTSYSADHTLVASDAGNTLLMTATAVVSVPTDATTNFPINTQIPIIQTGNGAVGVVAANTGTTTIYVKGVANGTATIYGKGYSIALIKTSANTWYISGALQ